MRVHRLADYVYFNHSIHVAKGVGCSTCHGQVNQMPLMFQASPLQMAWCLDCHRNPEAVLRPHDQVFNMDWKAPANQAEIGKKLAEEYKIRYDGRADQLLDVSSLAIERYCVDERVASTDGMSEDEHKYFAMHPSGGAPTQSHGRG